MNNITFSFRAISPQCSIVLWVKSRHNTGRYVGPSSQKFCIRPCIAVVIWVTLVNTHKHADSFRPVVYY